MHANLKATLGGVKAVLRSGALRTNSAAAALYDAFPVPGPASMTARRVFPETRARDDANRISPAPRPFSAQRAAARPEIVIGSPGYRAQLRAAGFHLPRERRSLQLPAIGLVGAAAAGFAALGLLGAVWVSQEPAQVTFALVPSEVPAQQGNTVVVVALAPEGAAKPEELMVAASQEAGMADEDSDVAAASQPAPAAPQPSPAPAQPTPAPVPTRPAPPPVPPLTESEFRAIALSVGWPAAVLDEVVAVAMCESDLRPAALGAGTYGLMQLTPWWFEASGVAFDAWSDPASNLKAALYLYRMSVDSGSSGWHHWGCKP